MQNLQRELQTALHAVRVASIVCRSVQSRITSESLAKKDNSPVTVADFASQAIICRILQQAFPDDPVIGEEGAAELKTAEGSRFLQEVVSECAAAGVQGTAEEVCQWIDRGNLQEFRSRFWTLDPIDGTKGFLRKEQYAISLALVIDGNIHLGVLGCPNMPLHFDESVISLRHAPGPVGVIAWATKGYGSWIQGLDVPDSTVMRIRASGNDSTKDFRVCESVESGHSSHDWSGMISKDLGVHRPPVRMDSQCKYLAVARGEADVYLRLPTKKGYQEKIWDHAGGILIVEEAGGRVTDIHGRTPDLRSGAVLAANEGMVVTNGKAHDQVLASISRCAPPTPA